VVLFDADPTSWRRRVGRVANRDLTRTEWSRSFPDEPYRRTIRRLPWPLDLPDNEKTQGEAFEREHPEEDETS
jgi:hypothetical protein